MKKKFITAFSLIALSCSVSVLAQPNPTSTTDKNKNQAALKMLCDPENGACAKLDKKAGGDPQTLKQIEALCKKKCGSTYR